MRTGLLIAALALVVAAISACGDDGDEGDAPVAAGGKNSEAGELFVQRAASGTLRKLSNQSGAYQLVLKEVDPAVIAFTDRPARRASREGIAEFVQAWDGRGFAEVPPNAALEITDAGEHEDVIVLELSEPRYEAGTLTYRAQTLAGEGPAGLSEFIDRADESVPTEFTAANLFIDPGDQTQTNVSFTFQWPSSDFLILSFDRAFRFDTTSGLLTFSGSTDRLNVTASTLTLSAGPNFQGSLEVTLDMPSQVAAISGTLEKLPAGATVTARAANGPDTPLKQGGFSIPIRG